VVGVILRSRHFHSDCAYRRRIASPVELSVGLIRALDIPRPDIRLNTVADTCALQGQHLFYPPNVAGWAGGRRWITSSSVIERTNWLSAVVWGNPQLDLPPFDPLAWAQRNGIAPQDAGEVLAHLLLQGDLSPEASKLALATARAADADSLSKAIQILVHCPEYQLV
jgi:uncharacterized protein (DUF1800 family)